MTRAKASSVKARLEARAKSRAAQRRFAFGSLAVTAHLMLPAYVRAQSSSVVLGNAPEATGKPGDYVTLGFMAGGSGTVNFELSGPDGWTLVSRSRTVELEAEPSVVAFTLRIPERAVTDSKNEFVLKATLNGAVLGEARGVVRVQRLSRLEFRGPEEVFGRPGSPTSFEMLVTNRGNATDTFVIEAVDSVWKVAFDPPTVTLEPGVSRAVRGTLYQEGTISSGFFYYVRLRATASASPEVSQETALEVRFSPRRDPSEGEGSELQLTASVGFAATANASLEGDKSSFGAAYSASASVAGPLSDYATGSVTPGGISGDVQTPFRAPSDIRFGVKAKNWDASLGVSSSGANAGVNFDLWQLRWGTNLSFSSQAGGVRSNLDAGIGARSQIPGLNFSVSASSRTVFGLNPGRSDSLGAQSQWRLGENLGLNLNGFVFGTSSETVPYQLGFNLSQSLAWRSQDLELLESLSGTPLAGAYNVALFGSTRSLQPLAITAGSSLSLTNANGAPGQVLQGGINSNLAVSTILSTGLGDFSFSTSLAHLYSVSGPADSQRNSSWSVSPGIGYSFRFLPITGSASVGLNYTGVLIGSQGASTSAGFGLNLNWAPFSLGLTLGWRGVAPASSTGTAPSSGSSSGSGSSSQGENTTTFGAQASLPVLNGQIRGKYNYTFKLTDTLAETHAFGLEWEQPWTSDFSTRLNFSSNTVRTNGLTVATPQSLGVNFSFRNVLVDNLSFNLGYSFSSPNGLFGGLFGGSSDASVPSRHDLSFGLGYAFDVRFATPGFLIDLAGGRESGELFGTAFMDSNLNGKRDANEAPLAGLVIQLGKARITTDAQGQYRLRAPVGTNSLEFPGGLAANIDLIAEHSEQIRLNQSRQRDLPFNLVSSLPVMLFDDLNHNGSREADEPGIPYGGLIVDGPVRKRIQVSADGTASVSGLVSGTYTIQADNEKLPTDYRALGSVISFSIDAPNAANAVVLSAALPLRAVVTTFSSSDLAILASTPNSNLPAGAEVRLEVQAQGDAKSVTATFAGQQISLEGRDGQWTGILRLPENTPIGEANIEITATGAGSSGAGSSAKVRSEITINVVPGLLFTIKDSRAEVGLPAMLEIETLYRPTQAPELRLPNGRLVAFESSDGYIWRTSFESPAVAGKQTMVLLEANRELGPVTMTFEAATGSTGSTQGSSLSGSVATSSTPESSPASSSPASSSPASSSPVTSSSQSAPITTGNSTVGLRATASASVTIAHTEPWPNRNRVEEAIPKPIAPQETILEVVQETPESVIEDPMIVFFALEPQTFPVIELNFEEISGTVNEPKPEPAPSEPNPAPSPSNPSPSNPSIKILLPDHFENDTPDQFNLRFSYRSQLRR